MNCSLICELFVHCQAKFKLYFIIIKSNTDVFTDESLHLASISDSSLNWIFVDSTNCQLSKKIQFEGIGLKKTKPRVILLNFVLLDYQDQI